MSRKQLNYLHDIGSYVREVIHVHFDKSETDSMEVAYIDTGGNYHYIRVNHNGTFSTIA